MAEKNDGETGEAPEKPTRDPAVEPKLHDGESAKERDAEDRALRETVEKVTATLEALERLKAVGGGPDAPVHTGEWGRSHPDRDPNARDGLADRATGHRGEVTGLDGAPVRDDTRSLKNYRDLEVIAIEHGFTVLSTTGGKHSVTSAHGAGRAIDVRTRDHTDKQVNQFIDYLRDLGAGGLRVLDERQDLGLRGWSGPHVHIEVPNRPSEIYRYTYDLGHAHTAPQRDPIPIFKRRAP